MESGTIESWTLYAFAYSALNAIGKMRFWVLDGPELNRLRRAREHVNRTADRAYAVKCLGTFFLNSEHWLLAVQTVRPIQAGVKAGDGFYDRHVFLLALICA